VTLLVWRDAPVAALSRFEPVASGVVRVGPRRGPVPAPAAPPAGTEPADDPYASGVLFHGPAFQYLTSVRSGDSCASGVLDAAGGQVPRGLLHQGLLDAAIHVIPHDNLWTWSEEIGRDVAGFPHRIVRFDVHAPLPDSGEVRVAASFAGFDGGDRSRPVFDVVLWDEQRTYVTLRLVDAVVPKGRVGTADPVDRRAFLRDRRYAGGVGVSVTGGGVTRLTATDVDLFDWLPGTVAELYGLPAGARGRDHLARIAVADHVGRLAGVHPADVAVAEDLSRAWPVPNPGRRFAVTVTVESDGDEVVVRGRDETS
jgi:hypothetical protein